MERIDELQRGGYRLIQDTDQFCFGTDAVLLADFAKAKAGEKVMDLCSGTGVVSILMLARYPKALYSALELQPQMVALSKRSVALNQIEDKVQIFEGDVRQVKAQFAPRSFQALTVNPPYMKVEDAITSAHTPVALARHEISCSLRDIMEAAAYLLTDKGRFYMVHKPQRLVEIIDEMLRVKIEPKRLRMVHPFVDKAPAQVLIEGSLHGGRELRIEPPLITYEKPGIYTQEMKEVYGLDGHHSSL